MSLQDWASNGWLRAHQSSREEIAGLLSIVDRDIADAADKGISADWRFGIAHDAARKLSTILFHASGYRPERTLQHYRTIQALPLILGESRAAAVVCNCSSVMQRTLQVSISRIMDSTCRFFFVVGGCERSSGSVVLVAGRSISPVLGIGLIIF